MNSNGLNVLQVHVAWYTIVLYIKVNKFSIQVLHFSNLKIIDLLEKHLDYSHLHY